MEKKTKKFDEAWLMKRANQTALAALNSSKDQILKAIEDGDAGDFVAVMQALITAAFMSGVVGTVYMQNELGADMSPLKESEGYKQAKIKFGKKPESDDDGFGA